MKKIQFVVVLELEDEKIIDRHDAVNTANHIYDALSNNYVFNSKEKCEVNLILPVDFLIGKDSFK